MFIEKYVDLLLTSGASDLHLRVGTPPVMRVNGELTQMLSEPSLTPQDTEQAFLEITTPEQQKTFVDELQSEFSICVNSLSRFRVSIVRQKGTFSLALRLIPMVPFSIDELGLPQICKKLALRRSGMVLVTGKTGNGKTTTLAALVKHINETAERNIITIEDPIEYFHQSKRSIIAQQELGNDTPSFSEALKHALRQDPDVIVIGEMRDMDSVYIALRAAATGHLVMSTMHTADVYHTIDSIDSIIYMFPAIQQQQIRMQLAHVLEAVIAQKLLPRANGTGRVAACEIMLGTPPVRNLIREDKVFELPVVMQLGSKEGMKTMNQAIVDLAQEGIITRECARAAGTTPEQIDRLTCNSIMRSAEKTPG